MTDEKTERMVRPPTESVTGAGERTSSVFPVIRRLTRALSVFAFGFFLGGTAFPLEIYPLGCALVAALPVHTIMAMGGILLRFLYLAAQGKDVLLPAVCVTALLVCRLIVNLIVYGKRIFLRRLRDSVLTRALLCAVFVFGISFVEAVYSGVTLFAVLKVALFAVSSITFVCLFSFFFEEEYRHAPVFEAGLGAVSFCFVLALMPFAVGDFSIGLAAAFAITFFVGFLGVPTRSALVGILCGLAGGGFYAPVLALAGLVVGLFSESYAFFGGLSAVLVTVCSTLYFGGAESVYALFAELLTAAIAVTVLAMLRLLPGRTGGSFLFDVSKADAAALLLAKRCDTERERRMYGISKAMESLSCMMQGLSEKFRKPKPEKLSEKCRALWCKHCDDCTNECSCRGLAELETETVSAKLASRLMTSGKIDREKLYEITKVRCPHLDIIAAEISACSAKMLEEAIREDKTRVFALDYETMAQMFADAAAEGDMRMPVDRILSDRLRRAFTKSGLYAENVLVCGDRKKFVIATGEEIAKTDFHPSDIRMICEDVCGMRFEEPAFMLEAGKSALTLESAPVFTVESVMRQIPKKGEIVCGDSVSSSKSHDDFYYCFLCDGMGSGEEAALTSKLCRVFLEKMLVCGNKKSTTLEMLNNLLCSRSTECFATVDLCEIDLVLGIASFLKSGAVPSYIIRGENLYKISSGTFPIGILPQVSAEVTEFELCVGDVILLCSDGIASDTDTGEEDGLRFVEYVTKEWTDDLSEMAEKILSMAAESSARADDMTVALLRIGRTG